MEMHIITRVTIRLESGSGGRLEKSDQKPGGGSSKKYGYSAGKPSLIALRVTHSFACNWAACSDIEITTSIESQDRLTGYIYVVELPKS